LGRIINPGLYGLGLFTYARQFKPLHTVFKKQESMRFPLFSAPGSVVFLDDDPDFLRMLQLLAPAHWHVRTYQCPSQ
jgi:hypothetical protein